MLDDACHLKTFSVQMECKFGLAQCAKQISAYLDPFSVENTSCPSVLEEMYMIMIGK